MDYKSVGPKPVYMAPEYAKFIGIILVVFGHTLRGLISANIAPDDHVWQTVDRAIYLFHMPLFFFLSGLFILNNLKKSGFHEIVLRYSGVLLVPLIVWSYIHFSAQFLASSDVNHPVTIQEVLMAPFPPKQHFWFLGALYICVLVAALLSGFRCNKSLLKIVFVGLVAALIIVPQNDVTDFMNAGDWQSLAGQTLKHMPYFLLGAVIGNSVFYKWKISNSLLFIAFLISIIGYISIESPPEIMRIFASIICVLSLYQLICNFAPTQRNASDKFDMAIFIGLNSMIIYLAHVIAAAGTRTILSKLGISDIYLHLGLGTLAGLLMPLILVPISLKAGKSFPVISRYIVPVKDRR